MEIEQIRNTVHVVAAQLDVQAPQVEAGEAPSWLPYGMTTRRSEEGPVFVIGSKFGELAAAEQEAVLAWALTIATVAPRYNKRVNMTTLLILLLATSVLGAVLLATSAEAPADLMANPWKLASLVSLAVASIWLASYPVRKLAASRLRQWGIYRTDRTVVETFGWPVMDALLGFEARHQGWNALNRRVTHLDRLRERSTS